MNHYKFIMYTILIEAIFYKESFLFYKLLSES